MIVYCDKYDCINHDECDGCDKAAISIKEIKQIDICICSDYKNKDKLK